MIEYNQMIDACHMARSHNLSALIEAEAKEAGALSTHFLLSLSEYLCSAAGERNRLRRPKYTLCAGESFRVGPEIRSVDFVMLITGAQI